MGPLCLPTGEWHRSCAPSPWLIFKVLTIPIAFFHATFAVLSATDATMLGIYGGAKLTHGDAIALGESAAAKLGLSASDRV